MRALQRTTHLDFGSSTCERVNNAAQHGVPSSCSDGAACSDDALQYGCARAKLEPLQPLRLALTPPAPTLQAVAIAQPSTAALAQQHLPLLRAWWQAAYTALNDHALTQQEIAAEDFTAMQRVMGLAMLEGMLRRWLSGCGPCGALVLPNMALMPAEAVQAVRHIHRYVITRPTRERDGLVAQLADATRKHIVAGSIDDATLARVASGHAPMAEQLAVNLFHATAASAISARARQTVLLGVFWQMLGGYVA